MSKGGRKRGKEGGRERGREGGGKEGREGGRERCVASVFSPGRFGVLADIHLTQKECQPIRLPRFEWVHMCVCVPMQTTVGVTGKFPLPFNVNRLNDVHRFLAIRPAGQPTSRSVSKLRSTLNKTNFLPSTALLRRAI